MPSTPISAPQDTTWATAVTDGTAATSNPYRPGSATGGTAIAMDGYTGVLVRAKYVTSQTLTTDPILAVFGNRGTSWSILTDSNGARTSTLSDTSTDVSNGTNNWTDSSLKIDSLGSAYVLVTVVTAAVASSGAVVIEITRY